MKTPGSNVATTKSVRQALVPTPQEVGAGVTSMNSDDAALPLTPYTDKEVYYVAADIAFLHMFGCDVTCHDPTCPLAMYHSKMAPVEQSLDVNPHGEGHHDELLDAENPLPSLPSHFEEHQDDALVDEVHRPDDWHHVPLNRLESSLPMCVLGVLLPLSTFGNSWARFA